MFLFKISVVYVINIVVILELGLAIIEVWCIRNSYILFELTAGSPGNLNHSSKGGASSLNVTTCLWYPKAEVSNNSWQC
jgi:hypothetical protein